MTGSGRARAVKAKSDNSNSNFYFKYINQRQTQIELHQSSNPDLFFSLSRFVYTLHNPNEVDFRQNIERISV